MPRGSSSPSVDPTSAASRAGLAGLGLQLGGETDRQRVVPQDPIVQPPQQLAEQPAEPRRPLGSVGLLHLLQQYAGQVLTVNARGFRDSRASHSILLVIAIAGGRRPALSCRGGDQATPACGNHTVASSAAIARRLSTSVTPGALRAARSESLNSA